GKGAARRSPFAGPRVPFWHEYNMSLPDHDAADKVKQDTASDSSGAAASNAATEPFPFGADVQPGGDDPATGAESIPPRPAALPVSFENTPAELQDRDQWMLFRFELRKGKWTKPPRTPTGHNASSTAPATWSTFAEVKDAYLAARALPPGERWDGV